MNKPGHESDPHDEWGPVSRRRLSTATSAADRVLHWLGRSVFVLAPVLMLTMLVVGLGYVRLRHGPMSLDFLVEPIERGINAELSGNTVKIDDVVMSLTDGGGLEFRLRDVKLYERDGDVVASAPQAAVGLSTAALWSGKVVPARVELIRPRVYLFYSEDRGLALSLSRQASPEDQPLSPTDPEAAPLSVPKPQPAVRPAAEPPGPLKRIDLARAVSEMSARARQRLGAGSYLRTFGLRDASVVLEYSGKSTEWHVPVVAVELAHARGRSVIAGTATITTGTRPWQLSFETDESEEDRTLTLKTSVRNLVPRGLAPAVPQLSLMQAFDMPVDGDATLQLTTAGDIQEGTVDLKIGTGNLRLPALPEAPMQVDGGSLKIAYDGTAEKVVLSPSTLRWRGSNITLVGTMTRDGGTGDRPWAYLLQAREGMFAASEFGVPPVPLQSWHAKGRILPSRGEVELAEFNLQAGGAEIALKGDFVAGVDPARTQLEGSLSPMSLDTLKALWPRAIAPGAREWVGERVSRGDVLGGTFKFESGRDLDPWEVVTPTAQHRLSFSLEAANLDMVVIEDMPSVVAPRALVRIENDALEVTIPTADIQLAPDNRVPLKSGRFTASQIMGDTPIGVVSLESVTELPKVIEVLDRSPLTVMEDAKVPRDGLNGNFNGKFTVTLPLLADLPSGSVTVEGKARITDGTVKNLFGPYDVQSASIDLDISERAADASGEMLVNGVLAKVGWQRIFDAPLDKQPPLRVTATLDNSDRRQLGLDINHIVQGNVPMELTITRGVREEPSIRLRADLSNADLVLANMSWRKPPGRSATLQCDIATGRDGRMELQNFKVAGDDIAIEGWAAIGADNRLREFYFPDFSLNVITRMEVQGKLGPDNVWKVTARGPTFDGRDFFKSLFSLGQLAGKRPKPEKPGDGIDLQAEIDTVIGFSSVNMRKVKMSLSKRGERITALDVRGTLDGGAPLVVVLQQKPGKPRQLLADSTDAGQAFKLIDFYPNIDGGRVRLEVNMDGQGAAEKTGTLWVERFRILGDPVVSEVFSGTSTKKERQVVRQVFDFDHMRVPFSVGYGQFVMKQSYLRGPLLGASIRGKVDFQRKRVSLGGSYIPLQGLNAALCEIPVVGFIMTGPGCEGVSGMTFAIQGSMDRPQVIVNPLSMLAPGIFREIFQMTTPDPKVLRRELADPRGEENVRASSTPTMGVQFSDDDDPGPPAIDGWSSETVETPPPMPSKK